MNVSCIGIRSIILYTSPRQDQSSVWTNIPVIYTRHGPALDLAPHNARTDGNAVNRGFSAPGTGRALGCRSSRRGARIRLFARSSFARCRAAFPRPIPGTTLVFVPKPTHRQGRRGTGEARLGRDLLYPLAADPELSRQFGRAHNRPSAQGGRGNGVTTEPGHRTISADRPVEDLGEPPHLAHLQGCQRLGKARPDGELLNALAT